MYIHNQHTQLYLALISAERYQSYDERGFIKRLLTDRRAFLYRKRWRAIAKVKHRVDRQRWRLPTDCCYFRANKSGPKLYSTLFMMASFRLVSTIWLCQIRIYPYRAGYSCLSDDLSIFKASLIRSFKVHGQYFKCSYLTNHKYI